MDEPQTWRELLGNIIASDSRERQRIVRALEVNPITLTRWVEGRSQPRPETLRRLLDALPAQREQLSALLASEYDRWFGPSSMEAMPENEILTIPTEFYRRTLNIFYSTPFIMRSSAIRTAILQQIITQLDPDGVGLKVIITECVPPGEDQKIHSLRVTGGRGTMPLSDVIEHHTMFLGAESLIGYAAINAYIVTVQDHTKDLYWPASGMMNERSSTACPILRSDKIAGCLAIACVQPHYFTSARLSLIRDYVELFNLAFEETDFYALGQVVLGVMPPYEEQAPVLASFQDRVNSRLVWAMQMGQPMTRPEAEKIIWKQVEQEIIELSFRRQRAEKGDVKSSSSRNVL